MLRIGWVLSGVCAMAILAGGAAQPELKRLMTTTPENGGALRMSALNIDRDWNPPVTHMQGQVLVEIFNPPHSSSHNVTIVRADEADYFEKTGELVPRGHVRVTVGTAR